jgi:hypothetical protein
VGRADLLRLFSVRGRAGLVEGACLLGYEGKVVVSGQVFVEAHARAEVKVAVSAIANAAVAVGKPTVFSTQARYFAVTERETLEALPVPEGEVLIADRRQDKPLPRPLPLVRASRLLPFLKRELSFFWLGGEPDLGRVLEALTRGKALSCLPFLQRTGFAGRICILLDVGPSAWPYRPDFLRLSSQLFRLRGKAGLDIRVLAGEAEARPHWQRAKGGAIQRWQMPPPGVPLLILSDLGCNRNDPLARHGWTLFGRALQAAGLTQVYTPLAFCEDFFVGLRCKSLIFRCPGNFVVL